MKVYVAIESTTDMFDNVTKVIGVYGSEETAKAVIKKRNEDLYRNYEVEYHLEIEHPEEVSYDETELGYSYWDEDGSYEVYIVEKEIE